VQPAHAGAEGAAATVAAARVPSEASTGIEPV
jgi:hypothetical protein